MFFQRKLPISLLLAITFFILSTSVLAQTPKELDHRSKVVVYKLKPFVQQKVRYRSGTFSEASIRRVSPKLRRVLKRRKQKRVTRSKKIIRVVDQRRDKGIGVARIVRFSTSTDSVENVCHEIINSNAVEYCQVDYIAKSNTLPNDRYVDPQQTGEWTSGAWGQSFHDMWGLEMVEAPAVWSGNGCEAEEVHCEGENTLVAVLDTGVDYLHPDIRNNIFVNSGEDINGDGIFDESDLNGIDDDNNGFVDDGRGYDFTTCEEASYECVEDKARDNDPMDDQGHGTHVAGTISAIKGNGIGIAGVAPKAKILPVKGLGINGGWSSDLAAGLVYAADMGADIINNSWGSGPHSVNPLIEDAVEYAYNKGKGSLIVFSAGNGFDDTQFYSPQRLESVLSVAAIDSTGSRAWFSNYGAVVDIAAPGGGDPCPESVDIVDDCPSIPEPNSSILSLLASESRWPENSPDLIVGDQYARLAGTSMAAPHVAGVAALVKGKNPTYRAAQLHQMLIGGTAPLPANTEILIGSGVVNGPRALQYNGTSAQITGEHLVKPNEIVKQGDRVELGFDISTLNIPSPFTATLRAFSKDIRIINGDTQFTDDGAPGFVSNETDLFEFEYVGPSPFLVGDVEFELSIRGYSTKLRRTIRFEIERAPGWPAEGVVLNSRFGRQTVADLDGDGDFEIIVASSALTSHLYAYHHDGTLVDGFPTQLSAVYPAFGGTPPAVADIDGDGSAEIFIGIQSGIDAFHSDGTKVNGWPQILPGFHYFETIAIEDIDQDGDAEIVTMTGADGNNIYVWNNHGELLPGWPKRASLEYTGHGPAIADINGDGQKEILYTGTGANIFGSGASGTDYLVTAISLTGEILPGFPKSVLTRTNAPAVGDIDGDGTAELVATSEYSYLEDGLNPTNYAWHSDPTQGGEDNLVDGWPVDAGGTAYFQPSKAALLADVDGLPGLEIITIEGWNSQLSVRRFDGSLLPGFPRTECPTGTDPAVVDLDGDGASEIIVSSWNREICAFNAQGEMIPGFPIQSEVNYKTPSIVDLDNDGTLELIASSWVPLGRSAGVSVWNIPYQASRDHIPWLTPRGSMSRTGNVQDISRRTLSFQPAPPLNCGESCGTVHSDPPPFEYFEPRDSIEDSTPTFRWTAIEGVTRYRFHLFVSDSFRGRRLVAEDITTNEYTLETPLNTSFELQYWWFVTAWIPEQGWVYYEDIFPTNFTYGCAFDPDAKPVILTPNQTYQQNPPPPFRFEGIDCITDLAARFYDADSEEENPIPLFFRHAGIFTEGVVDIGISIDPTINYRWEISGSHFDFETFVFTEFISEPGYFSIIPSAFQNWEGRVVTDVNGDDIVNSHDGVAILDFLDGLDERPVPSEQSEPAIYFDLNGDNVVNHLDIEIMKEALLSPSVIIYGARTIREGETLAFSIVPIPSYPDEEDIRGVWAENLPAGATFNEETLVFSWTPSAGQAGVYPGVRFNATDGFSVGYHEVTLEVLEPLEPLPPESVVPATASGVIRGDMNFDGSVDVLDIDSFITGLFEAEQYEQTYLAPPTFKGDADDDGMMDFDDVSPFIRLLSPKEPTSVQLVLTGQQAQSMLTPHEEYEYSDLDDDTVGVGRGALSGSGRYLIFYPSYLPKEDFLLRSQGEDVIYVNDTYTDTRFSITTPNALEFRFDLEGYLQGSTDISDNGMYMIATAFGTSDASSSYLSMQLFRYNLITGDAVLLEEDNESIVGSFAPSLSSTGRCAAYYAYDDQGESSLYFANFDSGQVSTLRLPVYLKLSPSYTTQAPKVSSDCQYVLTGYALESGDSLDTTVARIHTATGEIDFLDPQAKTSPSSAEVSLSANGRTSVYVTVDENNVHTLWASERRGEKKELRKFSPESKTCGTIDISASGRYVICGHTIYDLESDISYRYPSFRGLEVVMTSLSSDGRYIAFNTVDDSGANTHHNGYIMPNPLYRDPDGDIPGDANGDGCVNIADFTIWRDTLGQEVSPGKGADFNKDGKVDKLDYALFKLFFGSCAEVDPYSNGSGM